MTLQIQLKYKDVTALMHTTTPKSAAKLLLLNDIYKLFGLKMLPICAKMLPKIVFFSCVFQIFVVSLRQNFK
jgi:hypothetical protein